MLPIKGIPNKEELRRLGKIRLGIKNETEDGISYPSPTDYFVCPDEVKKVIGEKPKELRIMFPTEDKEQWASQYLRRYSDSLQLLCCGNGDKAVTHEGSGIVGLDRALSIPYLKEITCSPLTCVYYCSGECRKIMNLQFILLDYPGFGVYQLDTSSFYSMRNVNSALTFLQCVSPRISMIPLSLRLVKKEVHPEGCVKTVYVLELTWKKSLVELQEFSQIPPGRSLLIPPPDNEAPDDLTFPKATPNEFKSQATVRDEEGLLDLWARVKSKIWHFEVQDHQLVNWFKENYGLKVDPKEFDSPIPPIKFTSAMLSFFCEYIDLVCLPEF
jgi:hypothetical protein